MVQWPNVVEKQEVATGETLALQNTPLFKGPLVQW